MRHGGLGKGLAALIPERHGRPASPPLSPESRKERPDDAQLVDHQHRVLDVPIEKIDRNPEQPRVEFSESELRDLADSLRAHGVLQPLLVTRDGERFTLVAGERRLRAAERAGLASVPCLVHDVLTSRERLELSLIENVQRSDLNPMEQALAFTRLHEEFGLSHDDIARAVGKERPTISNTIRLLDLPEDMQGALRDGRLTFGQARGLLAVTDRAQQRAMFEQLLAGALTTRGLERSLRRTTVKAHSRHVQGDPQLALYEQELSRALGTRVRIKKVGDGGSIEIEYYSDEELSGIVETMTRRDE